MSEGITSQYVAYVMGSNFGTQLGLSVKYEESFGPMRIARLASSTALTAIDRSARKSFREGVTDAASRHVPSIEDHLGIMEELDEITR